MPQCNRASVDVEPLLVNLQFAHALEHLDGKGFIEFNQVHILDTQPGALQNLARGRNRCPAPPSVAGSAPARSQPRSAPIAGPPPPADDCAARKHPGLLDLSYTFRPHSLLSLPCYVDGVRQTI